MKKAKCKLCNNIIEIKNRVDMFSCPCGEITIDYITTQLHACIKTDKTNLMFVDDEGNEIMTKPLETEDVAWIDGKNIDELSRPLGEDFNIGNRRELLSMLDAMILQIDSLPQPAKFAPVTHSDFSELLTLIAALFRSS